MMENFLKEDSGEIKEVRKVFGWIFSSYSIRYGMVAHVFFCRLLIQRPLESYFGDLHDRPFILCSLVLRIFTINY